MGLPFFSTATNISTVQGASVSKFQSKQGGPTHRRKTTFNVFAAGEEEGTKYWPSRSLFVTEGSCPVRRSFVEAEAAPEFAPATLAASASGEGG